MKASNKVATQTESQIVTSMKVLSRAIETLTRLASNKDADLFKKDCIAFRNGLVGVDVAKNGIYEIPKHYNDYIDTLYTGKFRSSRQAVKNSIIACFYLGMNGTDSKGCIDKVKKGKVHVESIDANEWAIIKKSVKSDQEKAKATKKAKEEEAKAPVVSDTTQETGIQYGELVTVLPLPPVVSNTTKATTAPVVSNTTKVSADAGISKDASIRGEALYNTLFSSESEAVLIYLARKILAELQA